VVTHDMKLARKLADPALPLTPARLGLFGPPREMAQSPQPKFREFVRLDELSFHCHGR